MAIAKKQIGHAALEADQHEFEGAAVVGMQYEVRGIAGGLSDPAKFNPVFFGRGEEGYLVLKFVHRAPRFDPADKEDPGGDAIRVQILDVLEGSIIDEQVVADVMKHQREINEEGRRLAEEAKGITRLDFAAGGDESEFDLAIAHSRGDHAGGLIDACVVCEQEAAAEAAEKGD